MCVNNMIFITILLFILLLGLVIEGQGPSTTTKKVRFVIYQDDESDTVDRNPVRRWEDPYAEVSNLDVGGSFSGPLV